MNCRECNFVIHWPENWVKGMRPLEEDTNIEHTWKRCSEMKNRNITTSSWLIRMCECGVIIYYNRKNKQDINNSCSECMLMRTKL
jgi:hypothetical protein